MIMPKVLFAVLLAAFSQTPAATPDDTPSNLPAADPAILARAQEWFFRFQTGKIDRSQLDAPTNTGLTQTMIDDEEKTLAAGAVRYGL